MDGPIVTDWIQAGAAVLTMLAAVAALIVALKVPRLAAQFAEAYRRETAAAEELQRFRMQIFQALMRCRTEILAADARAAINLVDVAFAEVAPVRDARRLFIAATTQEPSNPTTIVERYHALIEAVARAMDFSDRITGFDVRTGYYPAALARLDEAALVEAEERIARRTVNAPVTHNPGTHPF